MISKAVAAIDPELLVVGARARSSVAKIFLGSITGRVLRDIGIVILSVPRGGTTA